VIGGAPAGIVGCGTCSTTQPTDAGRGATRPGAIARYALVWVAVGAALAALAVALVDGPGSRTTLPPLHRTQLLDAVRAADCRLRHAGARERVLPPVDGPGGRPARAAFYTTAPALRRLTAAVRRGLIVIYYGRGMGRDRLDQLRALQTLMPRGTIVAPDTTGMRYEVAVAAYRRLLGCSRFTDATVDAIQLFRGRHIGTGPDR
jgi:Protein of unknown function (DUF3105)